MPFISNAQNFTLGDGVYNNIQGDVVNIFLGRKRHRGEIDDALSPLALTFHTPKRQRMENPQPSDGLKVIRNRYLKLTLEIGSGPGYFLHAGQNKSRAVIVKVFNAAPNAREQLESTVALSKGLMHPNVLRIKGISSPASLNQFIVYENAHWRKAEGPLAAALKDNVTTSITLGFKMIAGLASGMNYLSLQGISLTLMRAENFDIFLDIDDRFLISINPPASVESDAVEYQEPEDTARKCWKLFNSLCQKVLRSANCVLHNENIDRSLDTIDFLGQNSVPQTSELTPDPLYPLTSDEPLKLSAPTNTAQKLPVPPRREYVWRTIDRGEQSLSTVANRITLGLDLILTSLNRVASTNTKNPHRCAGYIREEITLATTAMDSAVVSHDSPSPLEICTVCREVVGIHDEFQCMCGDSNPGSRPTVKCRVCAHWSHKECVGSMDDFTCQLCRLQREQITLTTTAVDSAIVSHDSPSPLEICTVSREVVGNHDELQCICGDSNPGSRHPVKCRVCARWSHKECVGSMEDFTCQLCRFHREEITVATTAVDSTVVSHESPSPPEICTTSRNVVCTVCREVISIHNDAQCKCRGDSNPRSDHTVKCSVCARWSHRECVGECVGSMTEFTCPPCRRSRIRVCDQCGAGETPSVSRFRLCGGCMTTQYCSLDCQKMHWPSHKAICQLKSQVAAVKPPTAGYGGENVAKSLRNFTSAHAGLLGWTGFQALQLKRNPANVHQIALLVELTPTGHSESHRRFSIAATHIVPRTYIRDPFVIDDIRRREERCRHNGGIGTAVIIIQSGGISQVMPVEVDPPSKISWDTRDDWARVLQHFVDNGRTDFQPISTTSRGVYYG